jgi:hypothetical protein
MKNLYDFIAGAGSGSTLVNSTDLHDQQVSGQCIWHLGLDHRIKLIEFRAAGLYRDIAFNLVAALRFRPLEVDRCPRVFRHVLDRVFHEHVADPDGLIVDEHHEPVGVTLGSPAFEAVAMGNNFVAVNASLTSFVKLTIVNSPLHDHVRYSR